MGPLHPLNPIYMETIMTTITLVRNLVIGIIGASLIRYGLFFALGMFWPPFYVVACAIIAWDCYRGYRVFRATVNRLAVRSIEGSPQ